MGVVYQKMMLTEGTRHNVYDGMVRLENFYPTLVGHPETAADLLDVNVCCRLAVHSSAEVRVLCARGRKLAGA